MEERTGAEYDTFNERRKKQEAELADAQDLEELRQVEKAVKRGHGQA
jgi:hypothetical protein